jgi:haloalkane dehalogenase
MHRAAFMNTTPDAAISAADPHPRKTLDVLDSQISYIDIGEGDPIVFLHGNPSSNYLWRNVIPHVVGLGRILAPDLVGYGRSGKSPSRAYRYLDQIRYLDAWFEGLGLTENVTLVLHDWGSALGFHRAARLPHQIRAIAYMESIAMVRAWTDFGPTAELFRALRSPKGESMVLDENFFVEKALPSLVLRHLSEEELAVYRAPFRSRDDRLPTLQLPRDMPIEGEPADVAAIVDDYSRWLAGSAVPKLFIRADRGTIIRGRVLDFVRTWPNQEETTLKGSHFLQEDSPHEIGRAIAAFVKRNLLQ